MPTLSNQQWRMLFGAIGVGIAIILGQTEVPLDPVVKLALTVSAGVIAFVRAPVDPGEVYVENDDDPQG